MFLQEKHESECRIPVQVITMKSLALEEAQTFIQFHGSSVGDLSLKNNLL